jgi:hypothetical protein
VALLSILFELERIVKARSYLFALILGAKQYGAGDET